MQWPPILLLTWLSTLPAEASSSELSVRNLPGHTSEETILEIRRRLDLVARNSKSNVLFDNSTSLDSALIDKTLFEQSVVSQQPASARSQLTNPQPKRQQNRGGRTLRGRANILRQVLSQRHRQGQAHRQRDLQQHAGIQRGQDRSKGRVSPNHPIFAQRHRRAGGRHHRHSYKLDHLPPPQINLNVDLEFPGYELEVEFDHAELYVALGTVISSGLTYTLPLYSSKELGIELGPGFSPRGRLLLGPGSQRGKRRQDQQRLPHQARQKGTHENRPLCQGILQSPNLRAGFSLPLMDSTVEQLRAAAGLEARVRESCALEVVQGYKLAVGAAAGASVALLGNTYGPTPATEIPVYYTTLAAACVTSVELETASASAVPGLARRSDPRYYNTTTTVTGVTYQAGACMSRSIVNCPASLQTVSRNVVTKTLTAMVPSGSKADWSAPAVTAFAAEAFGDGSLPLKGVSGRPSSYVPTTSSTASSAASSTAPLALSDDEQGGWTGDAGKVIGVSVGVGASVLVALVGVSMVSFIWRF
ncbi:hypothetical protein J3459_012073 [Metarhizium acridum]|nr:hypothetical protein J3459_012073 [Metarhizium acridum]